MSGSFEVSKEIIANDFAIACKDYLSPSIIDNTVKEIESRDTAAYPAECVTGSLIFFIYFEVYIKKGKWFDGSAGGLTIPGEGAAIGHVYTKDIDRLYLSTHSFQFNATPVYLNINFFDRHSKFLGHLQSAAISMVTGIGGGKGKWK